MITLKKLAELANVSVSTVSRALNDGFDIAPETRESIVRLARENGYFSEKKRIRTENRQKNHFQIAILCPEINSEFYSAFVAKLASAFRAKDCSCIIYHSAFDRTTMDELFAVCNDRSDIDAIISLGVIPHLPKTLSIPLITANNGDQSGSRLQYDTLGAYRDILAAAQTAGLTRLAFAGEPLTTGKGEELATHAMAAGFAIERFCAKGRFDAAGREAATYFAACETRPELIICAYDEIACGLIDGLKQTGLRVPEDIKVIGWNDISTARYCFGGLTSVHYDLDLVIPQLITDLLQDKKSGTVSNKSYLVPAKLIRRKTF